uniref:GP46-like surface antigen n=1 Tax=Neobodo designis TaxID=312471 RepID=A0A7S1MJ57_NEODS|mmetsp:Transcript_4165/g.13252  ORF Transcript_4165/g.13252 Transcript_4165/m.13252 type:complete len:705 (+) Transcript_4165:46-2160(+)|eukprot:CAMPEP_0174837644 /NCGR_PEP_ID=MMETSP1114-20130205/6878_1 /TAXON_ID=312471 /ORGANISM="Neobodo designis, Strain CCAP 1951/1" /LENGTH=704 /DNA_ID=CAMNT_0016071715 /DNA_START=46 /DNA_END=2160 /DNA_ORIENTATION=+
MARFCAAAVLLLAAAFAASATLIKSSRKVASSSAIEPLWSYQPLGKTFSAYVGVADGKYVYTAEYPDTIGTFCCVTSPLTVRFWPVGGSLNESSTLDLSVSVDGIPFEGNIVNGDNPAEHVGISGATIFSSVQMAIGDDDDPVYAYQFAAGNANTSWAALPYLTLTTSCNGLSGYFPCERLSAATTGSATYVQVWIGQNPNTLAENYVVSQAVAADSGKPTQGVVGSSSTWYPKFKGEALSDCGIVAPGLNAIWVNDVCAASAMYYNGITVAPLPFTSSYVSTVHIRGVWYCAAFVSLRQQVLTCISTAQPYPVAGSWAFDNPVSNYQLDTMHLAVLGDKLIVAAADDVMHVVTIGSNASATSFPVQFTSDVVRGMASFNDTLVVQLRSQSIVVVDVVLQTSLGTADLPIVPACPATIEGTAQFDTMVVRGPTAVAVIAECNVSVVFSLPDLTVVSTYALPWPSNSAGNFNFTVDSAADAVVFNRQQTEYKTAWIMNVPTYRTWAAGFAAPAVPAGRPLFIAFNEAQGLPPSWTLPQDGYITANAFELFGVRPMPYDASLQAFAFGLDLSGLALTGGVAFDSLAPLPVSVIDLSANNFTRFGFDHLNQLPLSLRHLDLSRNPRLRNSALYLTFPSGSQLRTVDLSNTSWSGAVSVLASSVPVGTLEWVDIRNTAISRIVVTGGNCSAVLRTWLRADPSVPCTSA